MLGLFPVAATAADLTVYLTGLRNTNGYLRLSLYNRPETFLKADGRIARAKLAIEANPMIVQFTNLVPRSYAVSVHHDENGDGSLNRNLLGIPREGYGFSNDARPVLAPPSFSNAEVRVGLGGTTITITLRY